ncbi:MAG: hypothetical protein JWM80_4503 [Cyanobacteria bacterium RYN_339]|nr:hypothetical protein [Cyanobacteria bacterium RYN_339]
MESTIPRAKLLELIQQQGQPGSAQLVEDVMDGLGWGAKQDFTKNDFIAVMEGVTAFARDALREPGAFGGASPEERKHVGGMLDALDQHAFPLMKDEKP